MALYDNVEPPLAKLKDLMKSLCTKSGRQYDEVKAIISKLNLNDLNRTIYQCDNEDRDMGKGPGSYNIPGYGPLVYCGTQGFVSVLVEITPNNDLGHPLCNNLRQGDWMIDYIHERIAKDAKTAELSKWIAENFAPLKEIPRYLIPSYFDVLVTGIHKVLIDQCIQLMAP